MISEHRTNDFHLTGLALSAHRNIQLAGMKKLFVILSVLALLFAVTAMAEGTPVCTQHQYTLSYADEYVHTFKCSVCQQELSENHCSCDPDATECGVCVSIPGMNTSPVRCYEIIIPVCGNHF